MMARRATHRFLTTTDTTTSIKSSHVRGHSFDFDESDLWTGSTQSPPPPTPPPTSTLRQPRKAIAPPWKLAGEFPPASAPVNVPDWSKILREEYKEKWSSTAGFAGAGEVYGGDDGGEEEWAPPHVYLARTRNASFSMQEGIGRTLKGRDLSRVRNAIWEKTGFQD